MNVAIEAVIDLDTCAAIDEVNEPDFVEVLTECDDPDVEDVAGDVVFPSNSSSPPCMHLETAECIEERPNLEVVIIPAELETEEVDVPTDEPFGLDDSSAGHHVVVRDAPSFTSGAKKDRELRATVGPQRRRRRRQRKVGLTGEKLSSMGRDPGGGLA